MYIIAYSESLKFSDSCFGYLVGIITDIMLRISRGEYNKAFYDAPYGRRTC